MQWILALSLHYATQAGMQMASNNGRDWLEDNASQPRPTRCCGKENVMTLIASALFIHKSIYVNRNVSHCDYCEWLEACEGRFRVGVPGGSWRWRVEKREELNSIG